MGDRFADEIWPLTLELEGGLANRRADAGGPTKYGITWRALMDAWDRLPAWCRANGMPYLAHGSNEAAGLAAVRQLTRTQAFALARQCYWLETRACRLSPPWDRAFFDWRFNGGPAARRLQELAGVEADGVIGAATAAAVRGLGKDALDRYHDLRLEYLRGLGGPQGWDANGAGWTARVERVRRACITEFDRMSGTIEG